MRAALISLPQPGEDAQPSLAGKTIAQRQLLFARECGCTMVIAHGGGASEDAIAMRHAAEKAGMRYQVISNTHALSGAIGNNDTLLVLQPGLLPEAKQALDLLRAEGDRLLIVSAGPGAAAGLERIDLDRAWGGAMTLPGSWLERLGGLPEDAAPHAALLRIALQQRLPEARMADTVLDDGRWMIVDSEETARWREKGWLRDHLGDSSSGQFSRWIAQQTIGRAGSWLVERAWSRPAFLGFAAVLLGSSVAAAIYDSPVAAFALAALSVPVLEAFFALSRLIAAPFGRTRRLYLLRHAVDAALLTVSLLSIDSLWYRAAFPSFVLIIALVLLDRGVVRPLIEPLCDRGLVAVSIAALAVLTSSEIAIMLVAFVVLAARLSPDAKNSG